MLVKDILIYSCQFLDMGELADKLSQNAVLNEEEEKQVANLEKAFNLVREEISTELLPSIKAETVKTKNLKVLFSELSSFPVSIIAVKDNLGRNVRHRVMGDYLIAYANEVEIWYVAKPEILTKDDEFSSTLPERIYAYGVARESYIQKALYKDAEIWEERFKNSIEMLQPKKSGRKIAGRRWL